MTDEPTNAPAPPPGRGRSRAPFAVGALLLVLVLAVGAYLYATSRSGERPLVNVPAGRAVTITVPKGATTAEIGQLLAEQGVVPNPRTFRNKVRDAGAGESLLAGTYELETGMGYEAAIASLTAGPRPDVIKVTIPEGFTAEQIAARLQAKAGVPKDEFLRLARTGAPEFAADHPVLKGAFNGSLEGFLFPKTYEIKRGASARDVIQLMLNQFDTEIDAVDMTWAKQHNLTVTDVVTVASLVEREAKLGKDRPYVASVIYNRLRNHWRLGIDATIHYVLPVAKPHLSLQDLQIDSPYNTYRHFGLPPGPITNPGLTSLNAAAHPADSSFMYWVLTNKNGSLTFARTNEEFLRAKAKSKKVLGE